MRNFLTPIVPIVALWIPTHSQELISVKSDSTLTSMILFCQDNTYMWAMSDKGLVRINNANYKVWLITEKNSQLPSNHVYTVACLNDGRAYIATDKGIAYWDNYGFTIITTENSNLPENDIINLTFTPKLDLLIFTRTHGVYKGIGRDIKPFKLIKID